MTLKEYQKFTRTTAIYPQEQAAEYLTLGLVGEAGEIANKVKKVIRDQDNWSPEQFEDSRQSVKKEIGDVFWYLVRLVDEMGEDAEQILQTNADKLQSRKDRGVIGGSGDER